MSAKRAPSAWPMVAAILVIATITVALGTDLVMPASFRVTRSIRIPAPPVEVFRHLSSADEWLRWLPVSEEHYPGIVCETRPGQAPDPEPGRWIEWIPQPRLEWQHPDTSGVIFLRSFLANERVNLAFHLSTEHPATDSRLDLRQDGLATVAVWESDFVGVGLASRFVGFGVKRDARRFMEQGLANLKALVEGGG